MKDYSVTIGTLTSIKGEMKMLESTMEAEFDSPGIIADFIKSLADLCDKYGVTELNVKNPHINGSKQVRS
jgi:hypothetical protein